MDFIFSASQTSLYTKLCWNIDDGWLFVYNDLLKIIYVFNYLCYLYVPMLHKNNKASNASTDAN